MSRVGLPLYSTVPTPPAETFRLSETPILTEPAPAMLIFDSRVSRSSAFSLPAPAIFISAISAVPDRFKSPAPAMLTESSETSSVKFPLAAPAISSEKESVFMGSSVVSIPAPMCEIRDKEGVETVKTGVFVLLETLKFRFDLTVKMPLFSSTVIYSMRFGWT